ncbi:MAG TPA: TRIC cation channel family protein [Candidatus Angelobacter sp.]|nr:TRIC cation channel family protein [Candidatus Angelobacter sp.]
MSTPVYTVAALPYAVDMAAVSFGALSGALHATRKGLDPVGVLALALISGIGGGAIRDVLLQSTTPVFLVSPAYLASAALAAVVAVLFARLVHAAMPVIGVVDTLLIGVWVVIGAERALLVGLSASSAAFLGVITATGGGLLRDLLCHEVPAAVRPGEWYVGAAVLASLTFVLLVQSGVALPVAQAVTIVVAAALRTASVRLGWRTPTAYDLWGDLESRLASGLGRPPHE